MLNALLDWFNRTSLVLQIVIALVLGGLVAWLWPAAAQPASLLGSLFIAALKAVAPVLVLLLVMAAISSHRPGQQTQIKPVLWLYVLGTLAAACVAVAASALFPSVIHFREAPKVQSVPGEISQVLSTVVQSLFDNPVNALLNANYIGILAWAIALGIALRHATPTTRTMVEDFGHAITRVIQGVIRLAPFGIFGLVVATFSSGGLEALKDYAHLLAVLVGCMVFVALVINPVIVWTQTRRNPYPLVLTCLRESAVTAFFTRSSGANIPVNLALAQKLRLDENTYSISIPLGATINMAADAGRRPYAQYSGGHPHGHIAVRGLCGLCLRRLGRTRWLAAADSSGLQPVQHPQRCGNAGGGCRLCDRRDSGLDRDSPQFLDRRAVYRSGLPRGRAQGRTGSRAHLRLELRDYRFNSCKRLFDKR